MRPSEAGNLFLEGRGAHGQDLRREDRAACLGRFRRLPQGSDGERAGSVGRKAVDSQIKIEHARWGGGRGQAEYMKKNLRLLAFYLVPVALLSGVDITYEWFAPLTIEDGTTIKWYAFAGLRGGLVGTGNNETGRAAGFTLTSHAPQFIPLPFYV